MRQKFTAAVIFLLSIVTVYFVIALVIAQQARTDAPVARNGVLDLTNYDILQEGSLALNGEWKFIDRHFLTQDELEAGAYDAQARTVAVPGQRKDYPRQGNDPASFGYGTYTLRIILGDGQAEDWAIKTSNIGMAHTLFVNGTQVGQSGTPGTDKASYTPGNVPYQTFFRAGGSEIDVILWVSNYDYTLYGGIIIPILFGTQQQIVDASMSIRLMEATVATALLMFSIIFACIYLYQRGTRRPLYLGLHCLTGALYILTHGEKLLMDVFPSMNYLFFARLQYLFPEFNLLVYLLFLNAFYPGLFRGFTYKALLAATAALLLPGFFFPLPMQSVASGYQMILYISVILYSVYMLTLGIIRGMKNAAFVGASAVLTLSVALLCIGNLLGSVQMGWGYLLGTLLFCLNQVLLLAVRVVDTYGAVEELNAKLALEDRRKDEFLAMTSHEFRTPLHGIMNIVGMYMEKERRFMEEDDLQGMRLVVEITKRLSRLVNDILDVGRIRSGRLRLEKTRFPLRRCLIDVVDVCCRVYAGNEPQIALIMNDALPDVYMDRDRFIQILYNLIDNAVNHTRAGQVTVHAEYADGRLTVSVADNGSGIPPEQLEKIFDLCESFDAAAPQSAGIGLSIVKLLAEYMGAAVSVRSQTGEGTTFTLSFEGAACDGPADGAAEPACLPAWLPEAEGTAARFQTPYVVRQTGESTVLIADDNFLNLKVILNALKADGHTLIAVKNGEEMMQAIRNYPQIDLVILDLLLPDSSGYDLCVRLRERKSIVELPVLILTAAVHPDDLRRALAVGANDFIHKPYPVNELRARVNSLLHLKRTAMASAQYEIAFLHAQVKPHFLYNALTAIASLCKPDSAQARELVLSLAKYLRGALDFDNLENLVPLEKELLLVRAYLDIEQVRYPQLSVTVDAAEGLDFRLPPMTLQVLTENAVRHGAVKLDGAGSVHIVFRRLAQGVQVFVKDSGAGIPAGRLAGMLGEPRPNGGIGLYNVNARLIRHTGRGLQFENPPGGGFTVSFIIPGMEANPC